MNVYDYLIDKVKQGESFSINLEEKHLVVGNKEIIKDGKYDASKFDGLINKPVDATKEVEALYLSYKYSYPAEADVKATKKAYFFAVPHEQMTDEQMIIGEQRRVAQARLEGFVLLASLAGYITWKDEYGTWFWQSQTEPDLVILKKWIAA